MTKSHPNVVHMLLLGICYKQFTLIKRSKSATTTALSLDILPTNTTCQLCIEPQHLRVQLWVRRPRMTAGHWGWWRWGRSGKQEGGLLVDWGETRIAWPYTSYFSVDTTILVITINSFKTKMNKEAIMSIGASYWKDIRYIIHTCHIHI